MNSTTTRLLAAGAAASLSLLTACGGGTESTGAGGGEGGGSEESSGSIDATALEGASISVGSKDFDEQLVLGQIALQAFEAAGADVTDNTNLQGTNAARQALLQGEIDTYWEYSGTGWISHLGMPEPIPDADEQYQATKDEDLTQNNVVWFAPTELNNTYALAMNAEFTEAHPELTTLSDFATFAEENPDEATICVESEFQARDDGLPGLQETYGTSIGPDNVSLLGTAVVYTELAAGGTCNFGEVFTTDGRVSNLDLTVLEDDKNFFPIYTAALTMLQDRFDAVGPIDEVMAPVAEALTTEVITGLNEQVSVNGEQAETVAEEWLQSEGFIS